MYAKHSFMSLQFVIFALMSINNKDLHKARYIHSCSSVSPGFPYTLPVHYLWLTACLVCVGTYSKERIKSENIAELKKQK